MFRCTSGVELETLTPQARKCRVSAAAPSLWPGSHFTGTFETSEALSAWPSALATLLTAVFQIDSDFFFFFGSDEGVGDQNTNNRFLLREQKCVS